MPKGGRAKNAGSATVTNRPIDVGTDELRNIVKSELGMEFRFPSDGTLRKVGPNTYRAKKHFSSYTAGKWQDNFFDKFEGNDRFTVLNTNINLTRFNAVDAVVVFKLNE